MGRAVAAWRSITLLHNACDRRCTAVLGSLFVVIGLLLPVWVLHRVYTEGLPVSVGEMIDLATDIQVALIAWWGVVLIRRGELQLSVGLFLGASLMSLASTHAVFGLRGQKLDAALCVLSLLLSGWMQRRRALWLVFVCLQLIFVIGALVELQQHRLYGRLYAPTWVALSVLSTSYLLIALIVDRSAETLRETLAESQAKSRDLERASQRLHEEMERRSSVQQRLVHVQKLEAVGRVAGGVAHDFDNVLSIVLGYAQRRDRLAEAGAAALVGALEGVEGAARRGIMVSRRLLSFSRYEDTYAEHFDAAVAVRELLAMLRQLFDADVRVDFAAEDIPMPVCFDRSQFELVLFNIAANARDAMPHGGRFDIRLVYLRDCRKIELSLGDTGCGMSDDVRKRVFEPFYTTKPAGQGSGLGLAMVRDLLLAGQASIDVHSTLGQGARFRILLPVSECANDL
ncbi:sensor histidine kinase [Dyella tabacisoli]|uniref:histidine kinase n=1 Tax=Dyella tabacisoli TaxID=2282381 RepID=A0A369UK33_9GAMM|nr:ATP-binding protein [Dyella tabacisoli]RDD80475.1 histidine kinase [Dyella tabacisoli]